MRLQMAVWTNIFSLDKLLDPKRRGKGPSSKRVQVIGRCSFGFKFKIIKRVSLLPSDFTFNFYNLIAFYNKLIKTPFELNQDFSHFHLCTDEINRLCRSN